VEREPVGGQSQHARKDGNPFEHASAQVISRWQQGLPSVATDPVSAATNIATGHAPRGVSSTRSESETTCSACSSVTMHPVPCDYRSERANAGISTRIESWNIPFSTCLLLPMSSSSRR
jgi:hypothetical protein